LLDNDLMTLACYGALGVVGVIIIIIMTSNNNCLQFVTNMYSISAGHCHHWTVCTFIVYSM